MVFKQIPKGYFKTEYPLPHNWQHVFSLGIDNATVENCTYVPILMNDLGLVSPDAVIANPEHGSYAESDDPYCHKNSIIPKISFSLKASLTKGAIETDAVRQIHFKWLPVYMSFLNRLDASDIKTGVSVENILEIEHETTGKSAYPLWSAVDLASASSVGIHASATTALMGMTGNATYESIAFDMDLFYDALQYYTNAPMLRKVIGRWNHGTVRRDKDYFYHSSNFTNPMVKRINEYTFCGVLVYAGKASGAEQLIGATDVTDIPHVAFIANVRYDEWNSEFDQTSS